MMTRLQSAFCLFAMLLLLVGCEGTGGGYTSRPWQGTAASAPAPAQKAPGSLTPGTYETSAATSRIPEAQPQQPGAATERATLQPVKVGLLLPLSGQHAALGEAMLNAAQIALFDIGHNSFELLPYDTKGTLAGGKDAAEAVLNEGAELVLGPVFADAVRGAKPVTARAGANMIAFSTDWQLAGGNSYIMGFLPFDQVERITGYAASRQIGTIGVLAPASNYGQVVTSAYQAAAQRYGLSTAALETFSPQLNNLSPVLRSFTDYDARKQAAGTPAPLPFNAVLMPVGGQQASAIASLLTYYDMPPSTVRRLGTGLLDDESLAHEPGLQGAWFAAPSPRLRRNFEQRYQDTYGANPPRLSSLAYDATALAAVLAQRGLKETGQPAFDHNSIHNPNGFAGIDGIFRFRPDGTAERGLAVLEFRNGEIIVVDDAPKTFQKQSEF